MRGYTIITVVLFMCIFSNKIIAGPFGLDMGTPISKLNIIKDEGENIYKVIVPKPNTNFEEYIAIATPQDGLCKINAVGKTFTSDSEGTLVRSAFNSLSEDLSEKYGKSATSFDFLHANSIWKQPNEFAMSLRQNQRTLAKYWDSKKLSLPDNISSIGLTAAGLSSSDTYLTLACEFSNIDLCFDHKKEKDKNAL